MNREDHVSAEFAPKDYSADELTANADQETAEQYVKASWFYKVMDAVRETRIRRGLTQAEVAHRLGTTQSVIARMENAHQGNFSFQRFLDYAWACEAAPLDIDFVAPSELLSFVAANPRRPRTFREYVRWEADQRNRETNFDSHLHWIASSNRERLGRRSNLGRSAHRGATEHLPGYTAQPIRVMDDWPNAQAEQGSEVNRVTPPQNDYWMGIGQFARFGGNRALSPEAA